MRLIPRGPQAAEPILSRSTGAYSEQSAAVLAGILESADELFAALDASYCFVAFNAAFRREFTQVVRRAPTLGQPLLNVLAEPVENQAALTGLVQRAFGGEAFKIEQEVAGHKLPAKLYQVNITPILNTEGQAVVVAIVAHDITEKREAERKFTQLLEASPDAMLIVQEGVIEYINTQAETMFGYPHQALMGKPLETLVPQALRSRHIRDQAAYEKSPTIRPMGIGRNLLGMRADGTGFPVEISLNPLNVAGKAMTAAAIRDISLRKKVEDNLRQENAQLNTLITQQATELKNAQQREHSLSQSSEQYRAVFDQAAVGIAITTPRGRFLKANQCYCDMTGYQDEDLLHLRIHDLTHPDDVDVDAKLNAQLAAGRFASYTIEKRFYRKDGRLMWGGLAISIKRNAEGEPQYLVVIMEDITRRREIEQKLVDAQVRLQMTVEIARLGFWERDVATNETYFSPEWKEQIGYADRELPNTLQEWSSRLHPDDRVRVEQAMQAFINKPEDELQFEYRFRHRDGSYRWFLSRAIALQDPPGNSRKIIGMRLDITERKDAEQSIRQAGQHDALTGLPNRMLLFEYADHMLAAAHRSGTRVAILFIDLDRFKEINDTYGHEAGDAVLREVAQRLSASIRKGDIAGRLGGDEFLVILGQVTDEFRTASVAEDMLVRLNKPHRIGKLELAITPSIGIAIFPADGDNTETLVRHADHAMYAAKERGRSRVQFFTSELARRADDVQALENRMKVALKKNQFELYFQAIASTGTAQIVGAEALLRWHPHPNETVLPSEFLPMAEATGLGANLAQWVIQSACKQQLQWKRDGMPPLRIAVNVSSMQFRHKDFAPVLDRLIRECGIAPALVQIELSESTIMQDIDRAIDVLHEMHALGVRIALDHFGIGNCGIESLSRLPVDVLKIDRSFARRLTHDPHSGALTQAAIALGHALKLETVAGGIESAQALAYVHEHDCQLAQGFHLCEPMPARGFEQWYRERAG
jgi:diguanylate cyclase (GGDEF)-like protein/PAS domain S-box-containing protein